MQIAPLPASIGLGKVRKLDIDIVRPYPRSLIGDNVYVDFD